MSEALTEPEQVLFNWISQILDELEKVLPLFAVQAAEQAYKAYPDISTLFEKRQVKALQQDIQHTAQEQTQHIIGLLANEELWMQENVRKVREHIHYNQKVWKVIQQLTPALDLILEKYGYPPQTTLNGPRFSQTELISAEQFPASEQLKVLTIKYWSSLMRFRQVQIDQLKQAQASHHHKLDEMWHH